MPCIGVTERTVPRKAYNQPTNKAKHPVLEQNHHPTNKVLLQSASQISHITTLATR